MKEKLFCPFDGRIWKIGFHEQTEDGTLIELLLQNEDISDWSELFTFQSFNDIPYSAREFISLLEQSSKKRLPENQKFRFKLIASDPINLFESSFIVDRSKKDSSSLLAYDEYNVGRILRGKTTLYYLRYSTKHANLFEQNKEGWLERFELAYLASSARPDQLGHWLTFTPEGVFENQRKLVSHLSKRFISDSNIGYALSLPKDWVIENQANQETVFDSQYPYTVSLLFASSDQSIYGGLAFLDLPKEMLPSTFKPRIRYVKQYKKLYPQAKLVGKGAIQTILGQRGNYLLMVDGDKMGWITFWTNSQRIYRLELWTKRTEFKKIKKEFEKIMLNFQYTQVN